MNTHLHMTMHHPAASTRSNLFERLPHKTNSKLKDIKGKLIKNVIK